MSKPLVILADQDEKYLETLERKFLEEIYEHIDLEIISDPAYFQEYFSSPRTAEILVVSEGLYSLELQKHNIAHSFILKEENEVAGTDDLLFTPVYKYSTVKDLFNELTYQSRDRIFADGNEKQETMVIALYSAIGGAGKTSLSLGIAACLARNHQRVLYISSESIQSFHYYLKDQTGMPNDGYRAIREDTSNIYSNIKPFLRKEEFIYFPPFQATLDAVNLSSQIYVNLVQTAKRSREYDYIVVDIEAGYSRTTTEVLQEADKVIMVMTQEADSVFKTNWILRNIDFHDSEKYVFVCNKYDGNREDAYYQSDIQKKFPLQDRIPMSENPAKTLSEIAATSEIQKLAYMFV